MSQDFFDVLARLAPADDPERLNAAARVLSALSQQMTFVLEGLKDASARQEILSRFNANVLASLADANRPRSEALTPELREWARATFNEEEFLAGVREIQQTGGLTLEDFIEEIEKRALPRE